MNAEYPGYEEKIPASRIAFFVRALLSILQENPDGLQAKDVITKLSQAFPLTEHEKGKTSSGRHRFTTMIYFAVIPTVKAGWLLKDTSCWRITKEGIQALTEYPDPQNFYKRSKELAREWERAQSGKGKTDGSEDHTVTDEVIEDAIIEEETGASAFLQQTRGKAKEFISDYLASMPPYVFQSLVADLLRAMGYYVLWDAHTPGPDGGVDIIAHSDPLGMQQPRIKVQVKRQKHAVSMPEVKSFQANIGTKDAGIFVCTGGFTSEAERHIRSQETKHITLINQTKLLELWIEYSGKLDNDAKQKFPLTPVYLLAPSE